MCSQQANPFLAPHTHNLTHPLIWYLQFNCKPDTIIGQDITFYQARRRFLSSTLAPCLALTVIRAQKHHFISCPCLCGHDFLSSLQTPARFAFPSSWAQTSWLTLIILLLEAPKVCHCQLPQTWPRPHLPNREKAIKMPGDKSNHHREQQKV